MSEAKFPALGIQVNIEEVHTTIIQPYIRVVCTNIEKRFGDAAGNISIAATIFNPTNVNQHNIKQQEEHVQTLSKFFGLDQASAMAEWVCFRNYLLKHKTETCGYVLKCLLTSDVGDSYPQLCQLAGIVLACPVGTAGETAYYSFLLQL